MAVSQMIGASIKRREDPALVTGTGTFVDDIPQTAVVHMTIVRSTESHARIVAIDKKAASVLPGVVAIFTGEELARAGVKPLPKSPDFKRADGSPTASALRPSLAVDTVRFVGEAVAVVVAQTREQARDAVDAIEVRYETLPMVVDPVAAVAAGAPLV